VVSVLADCVAKTLTYNDGMLGYRKNIMESKESIDLDLSNYLSAVKRRWIPALIIFTGTAALGLIAASLIKPSYQADGKLLFKNPSFKVVGTNLAPSSTEGGESGDLKSLVSTQNPIATQMEVMTSRPLLQRLIDRLELKNDKGKALKPIDLQTAVAVKILGGSDILQVSYKNRDPNKATTVVNTLMALYLENDVQTNSAEAEAARLFMSDQLPKTQRAVNEAEVALRKFKQQNNVVDLGEEGKSAVSIIGNLETTINTTQAQLDEVMAQASELKQKVNLNSQESITVSAISQSPAIQGILSQQQEIERQLATESSRFADSNPIIISLKAKQAQLATLLEQQIRDTVGTKVKIPAGSLRIGDLKQNMIKDSLQAEIQSKGLIQKLTSLKSSRAAYEKRVSVMPQLVQNQRQLERQLEVAQSTHQTLLKKVRELQLVKNKNTSTARIIANATLPDKPDNAMKTIVSGLGMLLGALFGTSAIAYLEIKDKSLKTVQEIDKLFGYTLLGVIPAAKNKQKVRAGNQTPVLTTLEVAVRDTPQSVTSEMAQSIQSNLRFLGLEKQLQTITITSSIANEGKSKVAANLAAAIAGVGQKVLLIDADMRVPYQHQFWKLPLKKGLSDILGGKSKLTQISWTVMDNLDLLTAGSRPQNALSYLESPQMKSLLREVASLYDFVIIDTPPLLAAADTLSVGQMTDGILLVSRPGIIDADSAHTAQEKLKMAKVNMLGLIVNGVITANETKDYFACANEYFTDEHDAEAPWTDYMTQLGTTIASQSQQVTPDFSNTTTAITMLKKSANFKK
jgi:capsular exopolysaccharide synthesis family protein